MGCGQSTVMTAAAGNDVDAQLARMAAEEENNFKILLLGAGESGKSTVVKQIKVLFKGGATALEKEEYKLAIRRNTIESMQTLIEAMNTLNLQYEKESNKATSLEFAKLGSDATLNEKLGFEVDELWKDSGMQQCYARRCEFWLLDACNYYFTHAVRIGEEEYSPSDEDMIMTRVRTTGIVVTEFEDLPQKYQLVDVGGQRSERRKWINCFDDVKAIIFLEGLSSYNQVLFEDSNVNRMHESLQLFGEVVNNPVFEQTPIFLFLNKKDLFEELIKINPLKACFPDYTGDEGDALPALDHIRGKYTEVMDKACPGKSFPIHVTAARVRMDLKIAFTDVKDEVKKIYKSGQRYNKKK